MNGLYFMWEHGTSLGGFFEARGVFYGYNTAVLREIDR